MSNAKLFFGVRLVTSLRNAELSRIQKGKNVKVEVEAKRQESSVMARCVRKTVDSYDNGDPN